MECPGRTRLLGNELLPIHKTALLSRCLALSRHYWQLIVEGCSRVAAFHVIQLLLQYGHTKTLESWLLARRYLGLASRRTYFNTVSSNVLPLPTHLTSSQPPDS